MPIKEIQKLIESNVHTRILQAAIRLANISMKTDLVAEIRKNWIRARVFELQCHIAVLLTLHTGKRPGVLCGIKLDDVYNAKEFKAESRKEMDKPVYRIRVVPTFQYAVYKTVAVAHIHVNETLLILLEVLCNLRQIVDQATLVAWLLTSCRNFPLCDIWDLLTKAWRDADCASRFDSTMMRHTIVTHSRNGQKKLTREEIKALA